MADDKDYIKEREEVVIKDSEIKIFSEKEGIFSNTEVNDCETTIERLNESLDIFTRYCNDTVKFELPLTKDIREKLRKLLDDD